MFEFAFVSKMKGTDAKTNYRKLADKYLSIARQVAEEMQANKDVIGCAVLGSTARGDVHLLSDIDLLVLVKESDIYQWERRTVHNIVVNLTLRSRDVLKRMAREHPDTIFGLRGALILYDPQSILQSLKSEATITEAVEEEFLGDLLDEARSFLGKAERALIEHDLESSLLCLRQGATKLAELRFYKERERRINPMHSWQEIQTLSSSTMFKEFFAKIKGFHAVEKSWLVEMIERLKVFLQTRGRVTTSDFGKHGTDDFPN